MTLSPLKRACVLALAALLGATSALATELKVKAPQVDTPRRVLMVGNSYFYYNDSLHNHLQRMVVAGDPSLKASDLQYKSATIGGSSLAHHNIDWLTEPGRIGVQRPFELVVLADGSAQPLTETRRRESRRLITEYAELIRKRGGQVALYMTHVYVAPHANVRPDNLRLTVDHYVAAGNEANALVIPVALAFDEAYRRRPAMKLHKDFDGTHPDLIGTYLAACVAYTTLYGKPSLGNSYDYFGKVSKDDAAFLQSVADDTVKRFFGR